MGKTKKVNSVESEEGQKKISSSFLKANEAKAAKSSLFNEVGSSVASKTSHLLCSTNTSRDKPIVLSDSEDFVEQKNNNRSKEVKIVSKPVVQNTHKSCLEADKQTRGRTRDSIPSNTDLVIIPETQLDFTPKEKISKQIKHKENGTNALKSPMDDMDSDFVPDTPENLKKEQIQTKRQFSRSYLLSSSEFGSNPIQKAKENREAKLALKRQQMSAARKGLVSVSVNFTRQKPVGSVETSQELQPNGENQTEGVTPTKISGNGFSLKRMSKSGVSPDAKRNVSNATENNETIANYTVTKTLEFDVDTKTFNDDKTEMRNKEIEEMNRRASEANVVLEQKRKEKIDKLEKAKQDRLTKNRELRKEQQKKNGVRQMSYQLHCDTGITKRDMESVQNDDVLDNILDELNTNKQDVNITNKPLKQSENMENSVANDNVLRKEPRQPYKKRYSLEKVLKFGQEAKKFHKVENNESSYCKKASALRDKLASEFSKEDEDLMMELDVESDKISSCFKDPLLTDIKKCDKNVDKKKKYHAIDAETKPFSSKTESTWGDKMNTEWSTKDQDFIMESEKKSDTQSNSHKDLISEKDDLINAIDQPKNLAECDNDKVSSMDSANHMIVDTTPVKVSEDITDLDEDIDEFITQLDSQMICDKIESFSPFKDTRSKESKSVLGGAPCVEFGRHIVTKVERKKDHMVLAALSQPEELYRKCFLHGNWQDTHVNLRDIVHILADFKNGEYHITDQCGFIVVNPDLLLSGTTVVGSLFCMRRSILKEKFKGCEKGNLQMLYGSILHSVFQEVLRKELAGDQILQEALGIVKQQKNLLEIYSSDVTEDKVMEEVKNYLPQIKSWTAQFTNIGNLGSENFRHTDKDVLVTKVNDIEENIWSPRLGIKGKIDLTVDVLLKGDKRVTTLPLELKTGRTSYSMEHKGQVTLYSMMSSDRRQDPGKGLLLYLKEPSMKVIPADQPSKSGLIQLRNEMAFYISRQVVKTTHDDGPTYTLGTLPDPISNLRACEKCPQLLNCAVYQRDVERRQTNNEGMTRLVRETLSHLSAFHIDYYTHWCLMLDLETQTDQAKKTLADTWCLSSTERENIGACFSHMVIKSANMVESDCSVLFVRHQNFARNTILSNVGLVVTDSVVISCESLQWIAVCTGFIQQVTQTEIQILIDREGVDRLTKLKEEMFRIDLCNSFSTEGIFYTNISQLMANEHRREILRSLIIERKKPEFLNTLSKTNIEKVKGIFKALNKPQKTAILKVLMSKHYVLIRGYPGTGKTSTIVAMVKVLNVLGMSVLLTSYTHSAVDNILLKLKKDKVKFLRLGRVSKVHPDMRESCADILTQNIKSVQELQTFFNSQMIVATSCLGTNHPMFSHRTFDVCIIDEASQVLQPACLGPLFSCKRFVLVGDSKQLPPVVQSTEARELGMDESLFVRLDGLGATFDLNLQYRMNSEIMEISNRLIYNNCLKCGTDTIANRTVDFMDQERVKETLQHSPWMSTMLDSRLDKSVVFLNTEYIPAPEFRDTGGVVRNETEARIVDTMVNALIKAGVDTTDVGIIAPYRSQVFLIRNKLQEGEGHRSQVEVNTVDQYQGRDKDVIIISFVRSSSDTETKKSGGLLNDVRRLNVAVTRAKSKLVMIGNISVLQEYPPLRQIIEMSKDKQQIVNIPKGDIR